MPELETDHRPWGTYTVLDDDGTHKVKRIVVHPGKRLSYQRHARRSEHWFIVRGRAEVTLDGRVVELEAGDSVDIPVGTDHRIANPGQTRRGVRRGAARRVLRRGRHREARGRLRADRPLMGPSDAAVAPVAAGRASAGGEGRGLGPRGGGSGPGRLPAGRAGVAGGCPPGRIGAPGRRHHLDRRTHHHDHRRPRPPPRPRRPPRPPPRPPSRPTTTTTSSSTTTTTPTARQEHLVEDPVGLIVLIVVLVLAIVGRPPGAGGPAKARRSRPRGGRRWCRP